MWTQKVLSQLEEDEKKYSPYVFEICTQLYDDPLSFSFSSNIQPKFLLFQVSKEERKEKTTSKGISFIIIPFIGKVVGGENFFYLKICRAFRKVKVFSLITPKSQVIFMTWPTLSEKSPIKSVITLHNQLGYLYKETISIMTGEC